MAYLARKLRGKARSPQGQILDDSRFGAWLQLLSSSESVRSVVEIGTWKGLGSTKIISEAIRDRDDANAVSFEANFGFHETAVRNLRRYASDRLTLVYGTLVEEQDLETENLSPLEAKWLVDDLRAIRAAPLVRDSVPPSIDLLLLDGGEFSSFGEFTFLEPRLTGWVLLDDTLTRKNRKVEFILQQSRGWVRCDWGEDRNGWSVWMKR